MVIVHVEAPIVQWPQVPAHNSKSEMMQRLVGVHSSMQPCYTAHMIAHSSNDCGCDTMSSISTQYRVTYCRAGQTLEGQDRTEQATHTAG